MEVTKYDIVEADLFGTTGSEQGGVRPAVVVQNDTGNIHSTTTIVIPLSKQVKALGMPTHTLIRRGTDNRLKNDSVALGEQLRSISNSRIIQKIGRIENKKDQKEIRRIYYANFGE